MTELQSQHTVRSYDDELKFLTHKIAEMGGHAERMVEQSDNRHGQFRQCAGAAGHLG